MSVESAEWTVRHLTNAAHLEPLRQEAEQRVTLATSDSAEAARWRHARACVERAIEQSRRLGATAPFPGQRRPRAENDH